jgi:Domain of unknown function (DUF4386)
MSTGDKQARIAGLSYLVMMVTVGAWYAVGQSFMARGPAEAVARIQASRQLFEGVIAVGAIGFVDFLVLGVLLYQLFSPVALTASRLMLAFVAVSVPVFLAAVGRQMDILSVLDAVGSVPSLQADQAQLQIAAALQSYRNLFLITTIFSGLWLIPFGWLVVRRRVMPRVIGGLLMFGSVFYVLTFFGTVFNPQYGSMRVAQVIGLSSGIAAQLGELGACLWLLVKGARRHESVPTRLAPV